MSLNYPCLEHIFFVQKVFEPLKFYCIHLTMTFYMKLPQNYFPLQIESKIQQLHGYPGHSLIKAAEDKDAGMIICGSRGQGLIRRTILGSISDYVLHHARMPVIICKHEDEQVKLKHSH